MTPPPAAMTTSDPASMPRLAAWLKAATTALRGGFVGVAAEHVGGAFEGHAVDGGEAVFQAGGDDVFGDALLVFFVDCHQREAAAHEAGDVDGGFAEAEDGDAGDFAGGVQAGVVDVAEEDGVVAFALGAGDVVEDFSRFEMFEKAVLAAATAMGHTVKDDVGAGVFDLVEDGGEHLGIDAVLAVAGTCFGTRVSSWRFPWCFGR